MLRNDHTVRPCFVTAAVRWVCVEDGERQKDQTLSGWRKTKLGTGMCLKTKDTAH